MGCCNHIKVLAQQASEKPYKHCVHTEGDRQHLCSPWNELRVSDACHLRKPASEHFHVLLENTAEISLLDMLLMQRACLLPDNVNMLVFLAENVEK